MHVSSETARRFILGMQGLWPGRRWSGKEGAAQAIRSAGRIQMDPLNVVARSHDIALYGRVSEYKLEHLDELLYRDRQFFDYGGCLFIYPMEELPYWRMEMRRRSTEGRWLQWAELNAALIDEVRQEVRTRGPLGNRDFIGRARVDSYRGRKDTGPALFYLWLTGELMTHSRQGFQRRYGLMEDVAPMDLRYEAPPHEAERFFIRKAISDLGLSREQGCVSWAEGRVRNQRAREILGEMRETGEVDTVTVEGWREPYHLFARDCHLLESVANGQAPESWRPIDTTSDEEAVFLAPLEIVSARGRAKKLFDFDYVWEVYKPAHLRKWGYYTLPILYGDRLVGRIDPKLDRKSSTLAINGFWLDDATLAKDSAFADAFARGMCRFGGFVGAGKLDAASIGPAKLRDHVNRMWRRAS